MKVDYFHDKYEETVTVKLTDWEAVRLARRLLQLADDEPPEGVVEFDDSDHALIFKLLGKK